MKKIKNIIQFILGLNFVRKLIKTFYIVVLGFFSSNRLFSIIYHLVIFPTFSREQHAILKARYKYYRNQNRSQNTKVDLRRNIHRLEKGLLMQPPRDVFALNYIDETVTSYTRYVNQYKDNQDSVDIGELNWAHDVLTAYFERVKKSNKIENLNSIFTSIAYTPDNSTKEKDVMIPYLRSNDAQAMDYENLLALSLQRRSVRWFEQKQVPRDLIDKALLIGRQSPSACNRMPFEYRIFDDPTMVKKVAKIPFGAAGYAQNIPTLIVLVGKLNYYFSSRDRHVIYIDASLSAMSFMLALETLGLSSSVINWPDFEPVELKMQNTLKLSVDERPVMLIAVGYPDKEGKVAYSQKKSLEVLRRFN